MPPLYRLDDAESLTSPALVVFLDLVRRNIERIVAMAGDPSRLRLHIKTHKMPAMIALAAEFGINKHKCATIAEAEMAARAGAADVLIAYPLVGPNPGRLARLVRDYPATTFRAVVDEPSGAEALSRACREAKVELPVLLDLDVGMGRTGIGPGEPASRLYRLLADLPGLRPDGLHAYDGHIHDRDLGDRRRAAEAGMAPVRALRDRLLADGFEVPRVVLGGTPTFPVHCKSAEPGVELSPGTSVFHDHGYATKYPDLPFEPAAGVLTRVVSRPRPGRLCLDVGYKAVAADPVGVRLILPAIPDAAWIGQSEEHLVIETAEADQFPVGTPLLAIPTHICPTCALYREALVVDDGRVVDRWPVVARDRQLDARVEVPPATP